MFTNYFTEVEFSKVSRIMTSLCQEIVLSLTEFGNPGGAPKHLEKPVEVVRASD